MPNSTRVSLFASLTLAAAGCTSSMSPGAGPSALEPRASAEGSVQRAAADRPAGGGAKHARPPRSGDDVAFERVELARDFTCEGANFADFDRDGDQDVVAGPWWYEGPDWKTRHALYAPKSFDPAGYSDAFFAWPCDVDHDGWTDVVTVGFPGKEAFWYRNALAAKDARDVPWERFLIAPEVDNESPAFTDLDGDGAPEIIATSTRPGVATDSMVVVLDRDGNVVWTRIGVDVGPNKLIISGIAMFDFDGDGTLEIAVGGFGNGPQSQGGLAWLNGKTGETISCSRVPRSRSRAIAIAVSMTIVMVRMTPTRPGTMYTAVRRSGL